MKKHTVLCVDDEPDNVEALERLFRKKYRVLKATSGQQALDLIQGEDISLIISDQRMPQMTGVEFLEKSLLTHPETMRILLTGYTDIDSVIAAINSGQVYRYINKPWDPVDLGKTVDTAIERLEIRKELNQTNRALQKALNELQVLDQAKSNFMLLINHELKTPLTSLLSYLQMLEETALSQEQHLFSDRMKKSANRLHELINDSLELVSAETGITKISKKKVKAKSVIEAVTEKFKDMALQKSMSFEEDVDTSSIQADKDIMTNILSRLVDNAIKFGDEESNISLTSRSSQGHVIFEVKNQGPKKLTQKSIESILKPFSLDENIMNHTKGTGLGLSVCQALLKTHESQLQIESEKNQFTVSFPLPEA